MDKGCVDEGWLDAGDGLENSRPSRRKTVYKGTSSKLGSWACLIVGWGYYHCVVKEWLCHSEIRQKSWEHEECKDGWQVHDYSYSYAKDVHPT